MPPERRSGHDRRRPHGGVGGTDVRGHNNAGVGVDLSFAAVLRPFVQSPHFHNLIEHISQRRIRNAAEDRALRLLRGFESLLERVSGT